jgi:hypothetical protein
MQNQVYEKSAEYSMESALFKITDSLSTVNKNLFKESTDKLHFLISSVLQLKFLSPMCILQPFGSFIVEKPRCIHNCTTVTAFIIGKDSML